MQLLVVRTPLPVGRAGSGSGPSGSGGDMYYLRIVRMVLVFLISHSLSVFFLRWSVVQMGTLRMDTVKQDGRVCINGVLKSTTAVYTNAFLHRLS